jgi:uncharacterized membrane protein
MLDPAIGLLIIGCCALLFASASLHKLRDLARFTEVLRAYRLLPPGAARFATLVPFAELTIAAGLIVPATRQAAALAGLALLVVYAAAIAVNLARGRRELACGCGGPDDERPIAPWMVGRNLLLALLLGTTVLRWSTRALLPTDLITVGGGAAVATLLYVCLDRLLGRVAPWTRALREPR